MKHVAPYIFIPDKMPPLVGRSSNKRSRSDVCDFVSAQTSRDSRHSESTDKRKSVKPDHCAPASSSPENNKLSKKRRLSIQIVYIIAVVLWILLLFALQVYNHRAAVGYVILAVPIFVYALGFLSVGKLNKEARALMLKGDVVSIAVLFLAAIFANVDRDNHYTITIMVVAAVLVLLSLIDIWTGCKTQELVQVVKSIFQTAAITLLIYVIYVRFSTKLAFGR